MDTQKSDALTPDRSITTSRKWTIVVTIISLPILLVLLYPVAAFICQFLGKVIRLGLRGAMIADAFVSFALLCAYFFLVLSIPRISGRFVVLFCAGFMFLFWGVESEFFWRGLNPLYPAWFEINMALNDMAAAFLVIFLKRHMTIASAGSAKMPLSQQLPDSADDLKRGLAGAEKGRNPWIAGILTFFGVGLGHLYVGEARRGLFLFFVAQVVLIAAALPLIYYYPGVSIFLGIVLIGFLFFFCSLFDAIRLAIRKRSAYALKRYNKWYVYVGCSILAVFVLQPIVSSSIKSFIIQAYKIPAGSLEPTILRGDHILARKLLAVRQGINRGDFVIFPYPEDRSKDFIKRVVALGGEVIEIVNKQVFINGSQIQEQYVIHSDPEIVPKGTNPRDNFGPLTVPEGAVFVMGDNRDESYDSRFWGVVEKASIIGKAHSIYWSWDNELFKVRWKRIGKRIE